MPFAPGTNVGPYRILEQLGQGGMATVYKAYHASLDRYVAIKVLHQAFLEDSSFQARFLREARLVARLEHPNIVPIYDYAEYEAQPYLVMKYIEGETLKARLERGPLAADEVLGIVESVGAALFYAHKQGILHRDIKPSNVILSNDGQIYLADFGLARIAQAGESTLTSDMILGTPQYISPEQALGKKDLDAGTDIYSFGVMLYEMIVGRVPFSADTPFSIIHDHIYTPLPLPRSINPNVPEDVERILLKCLAKERIDRYEDVNSLVETFRTLWRTSGVIGHAATLAMPVRPDVPPPATVSKYIPDAPAAFVPGLAGTVEPVAAAPNALKEKPLKRRSPWLWIALLVLLVPCCLFSAFVLRNRGVKLMEAFGPTVAIEMQTAVFEEQSPIPAAGPTQIPEPALPVNVLAARQQVEQNPTDPQAHMRLALAYYDAGMERKYLEELAEAGEVAGANQAFYLDAGRQLSMSQAWLGASAMFVRAANLQPADKPLPTDIRDLLQESVYKAASLPEFSKSLDFDRIGAVDQPLSMVARSRHSYYNGDKANAHSLLKELKQIKPGMHVAMLLDAEYAFLEGRVDEARVQLNLLLADLSTPEWVRIEAQNYSKQLP